MNQRPDASSQPVAAQGSVTRLAGFGQMLDDLGMFAPDRPNGGYSYRERIGASGSGSTVLQYLSERYAHSSRHEWLRHIEQGRVLVAGVEVDAARRLAAGELLTWNRPPWIEPLAPTSFAVLHADRDLLAVAKPRGMPAMPGGGYLERTLLRRVQCFDPGASPLHRLGRETSGITLFARNTDARRALTTAWQKGAVTRHYLGIVSGHFPEGTTSVNEPIGPVPHSLLGTVVGVEPSGKKAVSTVRLVERRADTSLVSIRIETGRTHQIRIHLAAAGHPLAGDPLYPPGGVPKETTTALPGDGGYLLHAHRLRFPHPSDHRLVELFCIPPPVLRAG